MEFYLSHMVVFRSNEMFPLNTLWGNGWAQYLITVILVYIGTVVFSFSFQRLINKSRTFLKRKLQVQVGHLQVEKRDS